MCPHSPLTLKGHPLHLLVHQIHALQTLSEDRREAQTPSPEGESKRAMVWPTKLAATKHVPSLTSDSSFLICLLTSRSKLPSGTNNGMRVPVELRMAVAMSMSDKPSNGSRSCESASASVSRGAVVQTKRCRRTGHVQAHTKPIFYAEPSTSLKKNGNNGSEAASRSCGGANVWTT